MLETPVSRILYSSGLDPADIGHSSKRLYPKAHATSRRERRIAPTLTFIFGLAPAEVYQAAEVASDAGGLLPHRFTLTCD